MSIPSSFSRFDAQKAAIIGTVAGLLLWYIGIRVQIEQPIAAAALPWLWLMLGILAPIGLKVAALLAQKLPALYQFAKYGLIGVANTFLSLATVNLLAQLTGIETGVATGGFVIVGFLIANTHSFFWNKHWTFADRSQGQAPVQYVEFLLATAASTLLAAGLVSAITHFVEPPAGFTPAQWLNTANLGGIVVSLAWNFFAYKFIIFRTKPR